MTNIENLKKEVDYIKNSLDNLKNNVSLSDKEKKSQAEIYKAKVDTVKQDIQSKIDELANKTDNKSKKEKEEAEALLNSLGDITNLYTSIINSPSSKSQTQPSSKDKNIFVKTKDWIRNQRDKINRDNFKKKPAETILRGTGFALTGIGTLALTYKGLKKLWSWAISDDDKDKKTKEKKSEKKSFRKTGLGRFLKWTGVATLIGGGVYGISKSSGGNKETKVENFQGGDTISEAMFQQLLYMEGNQDFIAKTHSKKFGENFVTGPYGMVYKHIDENGKLLNKPIPFKNGECVSKDWAEKNARAYYNKRAKERSNLLKSKGYEYSQDMLDALVSASGGTEKSVKRLKEFVLSHWDDKDAIFNFMSKFATTAAGNGKTMPGLVIRRDFEANWFRGNKEPMSEYQRRYYA